MYVTITSHLVNQGHKFQLDLSEIHVVTKEQEETLVEDPLKKCLSFYPSLQNLLIDERMVKSKGHCHLIQYMKNKPCKWGFKYWVIADTTRLWICTLPKVY